MNFFFYNIDPRLKVGGCTPLSICKAARENKVERKEFQIGPESKVPVDTCLGRLKVVRLCEKDQSLSILKTVI